MSSYTWANEVCAGDNEERAFVISSMNGLQYAVAAWLPILIFPQTMAPTFRKSLVSRKLPQELFANTLNSGYGFPATFGFVIAGIIVIVVIQILALRERRLGTAPSNLEGQTPGEKVESQDHDGSVKEIVEVPKH